MAKEKKLKDKKKDDIAHEAAKHAIEQAAFQEEAEGFIPDPEEFDDNLEAAIGFDIFDFGGERLQKGDQVQYVIKKNGEMLSTKFHPYTWDKLQKEYKGGLYQVVAKSMTTKRYLKSETRSVADPEKEDGFENKFSFGRPKDYYENDRVDRQEKTPGFMEMWNIMNDTNLRAKNEAKEMNQNEQSSQTTLITAMMTLMQQASDTSNKMFMELSKANQETSRDITRTTTSLIDKMNDKFENIIERMGSNKKSGSDLGVLDLLQMQERARDQGFDMFNKIQELADAKADEKMENLGNTRGNGEEKEKNLTESLIETILPAIASAVSGNKGQEAAKIPEVYGHPLQRRSLPQAPYTETRQIQPRPRAYEHENQTHTQAKAPENKKIVINNGRSNGGVSIQTTKVGLPKINTTAKSLSTANNPKVMTNVVERDAIEELLTPVIMECLMQRKTTQEGAALIQTTLNTMKIPANKFFAIMPKEYIIEIVRKHDLPIEAKTWFEEAYADLQSTTRMDNRGKPTTSI